MATMINKDVIFDNAIMVLLLLSPILWLYGNPDGWSYEQLVTTPLSVLFILHCLITQKTISKTLPNGLHVYFIFWGLLIIFTTLKLPIIVVQCFLTFFLFFSTFDHDQYIKIYKIFAFICICFFFLQEITFYTTGIRISGLITSLPLHYKMDIFEFIERQAADARSCSFFAEPAHYAQFLLPLLAIELFYDRGRMHFIYAIIIAIVLLLLQSGNGLLGMVPILLFAVPFFLGDKRKKGFLSFFLFMAIAIFAAYAFINSDLGSAVMERQSELNIHYEGGHRSGFLRVWRGYYVYDDYNIIEKIFGCPDEKAQLIHMKSSGMLIGQNGDFYFNAFQKVLLNTGMIGLVIIIYLIVCIWRNNTICGKAILASFIVLSFVAAIYMSHVMILYLVLAYSMKMDEDTILDNTTIFEEK